ncbi:hypothetical protein SFUMM280S_02532 [Streptomyces fumanus]
MTADVLESGWGPRAQTGGVTVAVVLFAEALGVAAS